MSELKVHIELTRFVQPEKIEIDANERAVNEKSQYCFFVCTTFDSFLNDLAEFSQAVEFATLYEGSVSSQRIQEYTATLTTRLQAVKDGIQGKILSKTNYSSLDEYVDHFVGNWQIIDVDISSLDDSSAEVVAKVLAKLLLDYVKRREHKADMPINFIIEEAHRFVKEDSYYGGELEN